MKKSAFSIIALLFLLWKPALSLEGAKNGLNLWAGVLLPTLLPFMLCSTAVTASGGIPILTAPFRPLLNRLAGLSQEGAYTLLSGLLCGYPMGAKTCGDFRARGMLSDREAKVLLAVSNHPSPMFLLGYVMAGLETVCPAPLFLAAVYLPIFPVWWLAGRVYRFPGRRQNRRASRGRFGNAGNGADTGEPVPYSQRENTGDCPRRGSLGNSLSSFSFDRDFMNCLEAMVRIGGYVMAFSILAAYIRHLSPFPSAANACLLGITEITTGILALKQTLKGPLLAAALAFAASFGGLSGLFQTKSVLTLGDEKKAARPRTPAPERGSGNSHPPLPGARPRKQPFSPARSTPPAGDLSAIENTVSYDTKNAGLSIRHYVLWKLLHASLSFLFLTVLLRLFPAPAEAVLPW